MTLYFPASAPYSGVRTSIDKEKSMRSFHRYSGMGWIQRRLSSPYPPNQIELFCLRNGYFRSSKRTLLLQLSYGFLGCNFIRAKHLISNPSHGTPKVRVSS